MRLHHVRKVAVDVVGDRIRDGASSVERPDEVEAAAEQELCELGPRAVAAHLDDDDAERDVLERLQHLVLGAFDVDEREVDPVHAQDAEIRAEASADARSLCSDAADGSVNPCGSSAPPPLVSTLSGCMASKTSL